MRAIQILEEEHRRIESAILQARQALEPLDLGVIERSLVFLSTFADRIHQEREERVLFRAMLADSLDLALAPIQALHAEHDIARAYLRAAFRALPDAARNRPAERQRLIAAVNAYDQLMSAHLKKEERLLFPLAERTLDPADDARLVLELEQMAEQTASLVPPPTVPPINARTLGEPNPDLDPFTITSGGGGCLFDDGQHQALMLHDFGHGLAVHANTFLIVHGGQGMILDPGGPKVYPDVFAETMLQLADGTLRYIILSHQDPDIGTSLNAWLMDTDADAYISRLWSRFVPHFGIDSLLAGRLNPIPDEGMRLDLGGAAIQLVSAHFLHSPGNFQVYDPTSKILFSGDLGASFGAGLQVIRDFDAHVPAMLGFHRRYMASKRAGNDWAHRVRDLDIEVIAPQHGAIMRGKEAVRRFIDWVASTPCGVDLLD